MSDERAISEIEITPEMVEAGASVLCGYETETASEEYWAIEVYRAMRSTYLEGQKGLRNKS